MGKNLVQNKACTWKTDHPVCARQSADKRLTDIQKGTETAGTARCFTGRKRLIFHCNKSVKALPAYPFKVLGEKTEKFHQKN